MAGFLDLMKQYGSPILNTAGTLITNNMDTQAANSAANRTQFMPYNLNLAGNTANFSGQSASGQFSGANQNNYNALQGLLGGALGNASQGLPQWLTDAYNQSSSGAPSMAGINSAVSGYNGTADPNLQGSSGQYLGASNGFLNQAQNQLGQVPGWQDAYNQQLNLMRQSAQPQEDQLRSGNYDNQFSKGILASSAGQYQTKGLEQALAQNDLNRQQQAFTQSQQFQQNQQNLGMNTLNAGISAAGTGNNLSNSYFNQGSTGFQNLLNGNLQQFNAGSSSTADRLNRALSLFGAQNTGAQTNQNLVSGYLGNTQGLENGLQNMIGLGGNLGSAQSAANTIGAKLQAGAASTNADNIAGLLGNVDWGKIFGGFNPAAGTGVEAASQTGSGALSAYQSSVLNNPEALTGGLAPTAASLYSPAALPMSAFAPTAEAQAAITAANAPAAGSAAAASATNGLGFAGGMGIMAGALGLSAILSNNDGTDYYGGSKGDYDQRAQQLGYTDAAQQTGAFNTAYGNYQAANPGKDMTYAQPGDLGLVTPNGTSDQSAQSALDKQRQDLINAYMAALGGQGALSNRMWMGG